MAFVVAAAYNWMHGVQMFEESGETPCANGVFPARRTYSSARYYSNVRLALFGFEIRFNGGIDWNQPSNYATYLQ